MDEVKKQIDSEVEGLICDLENLMDFNGIAYTEQIAIKLLEESLERIKSEKA